MRFRPFRFTGETYEADGKGEFRLRRRTVFERISSPDGDSYRFRASEDREEMTREEQEKRDRRKRAGPAGTR